MTSAKTNPPATRRAVQAAWFTVPAVVGATVIMTASLAWTEAFGAVLERAFPRRKTRPWVAVGYAVFATALAIGIVAVYRHRLLMRQLRKTGK